MVSQGRTSTARASAPPAAAPPPDWERIRFALSIGLYGGVLGAATILVNFLSQVDFPDLPERLAPFQAALFSTAGFGAGAVLTWPIAYWLLGPRREYGPHKKRDARNLPLWFILGFSYGILFSMVMGGIFLPISFNFLDFINGLISVPQLMTRTSDLIVSWPALALVLGTRLLFTGVFAGVIFGGGAWLIDRFNASADPITAKYGPPLIAAVLSIVVAVIVAFAPETTLARFG